MSPTVTKFYVYLNPPYKIRVLFQSSFPAYTVLFHEASCLTLLEAVLFHRDAVEAVREAGPDLTDN